MIGGVRPHVRLGLAFVLASIACARVPAELAAPDPAPIVEPPSVIVEAPPLACDGTLTAIVGERGVAIEEFERIYALKQEKYTEAGREMPARVASRYHRSISERVINLELLALEAAKHGVEFDPVALERRELEQRQNIADWDKHLRRRGEDDASLRALYVGELRERALLERAGVLAVSDAEVLAEYQELAPHYDLDAPRIHAAHILFVVDEHTSEAEAKAQAEAVYQLAVQPDADFAALAIEHSHGPSAREGGDLGIIAADRMVAEFSRPAFKLKPGEVSRPVKTKFGFHVIKVYGAWGPGVLPLEALETAIRERLVQKKLHASRRELRRQLLDEYAPINCVEGLAHARGLEWPDPPASADD